MTHPLSIWERTSAVTWIRPADKMPDENSDVLLCSKKGHVEQGLWDGARWVWGYGVTVLEDLPIVAWAAMPEGPR